MENSKTRNDNLQKTRGESQKWPTLPEFIIKINDVALFGKPSLIVKVV
jgi:hypothetical protein